MRRENRKKIMEIFVEKLERVKLNPDQQKAVTLKTIDRAFKKMLCEKGGDEIREYREPGERESKLFLCKVETDYHHGGDDISWIRKATEEESTLYNSVESLKKLIHEYPNK